MSKQTIKTLSIFEKFKNKYLFKNKLKVNQKFIKFFNFFIF